MALATCLSGCFSAPPQIISLEPNRGSTSVAADAPVRVVFDKAVTRASVVGRFSVQPAIPGCDLATVFSQPSTAPCWIHWLSSAPGFELLHEQTPFAAATRYEFTLSGGFTDPAGDANTLDHHWDLTSATAPIVTATSPGDRAGGVALDAPLSVTFNSPMDAPSTAAAISLDPPVAGTRVVRNTSDHTRFAVLPGALLDPGVDYTLSVAASARGEDQQLVAAPVAARFTTGSRLAGAHVAVLAGTPGQGATEVLEPALAPAATGEPVAAPVVLTAPRCEVAAGCSGVIAGAPMATYAAAAVSADGARMAVVVDGAGGNAALEVLDVTTDTILDTIPGGRLPSWSADGTRLALAEPSGVAVFDTADRQLTVVAPGATVAAPPLWASPTSLLVSPSPATPGPIEVVDGQLGARYALPGVPADAVAVATSPSGARAALVDAGGRATVVALGAAGPATQTLAALRPIGFTADGGLLGVGDSGGLPALALVSPAGDVAGVTLGSGVADVSTARLAPDGRRLAVLGVDPEGVTQVYVADADGSDFLPLTRFLPGGIQALAVAFSD